jgi:hypothetical protein
MLFLYRPRQTWMPYRVPRAPTQQRVYNRELQQRFDATRRAAPPTPTAELAPDPATGSRASIDQLKELAALHDSGALTDAEFAAAKAKLLDLDVGGDAT